MALGEFLEKNASALFALIGALGGGLLSFFGSWLLRRRDFDLKLWERFVEKRIQAHEDIIAIAGELRSMVSLGIFEDNEWARAPQVLFSKDIFEQWQRGVNRRVSEASIWLDTPVKRELNLLQDYLLSLHVLILDRVASETYPSIGAILRQDFIDFSANLERLAFRYFEEGIRRLKLPSPSEWHKYSPEETRRRLRDTAFLSKWEKLLEVAGLPASPPPC